MKTRVYFTVSGGVRLPPHTEGVPIGLPHLDVDEPEVELQIPHPGNAFESIDASIAWLRNLRNVKIPERKHATPRKRSKEALLLSKKDSLLASLDEILKGKEESNENRRASKAGVSED